MNISDSTFDSKQFWRGHFRRLGNRGTGLLGKKVVCKEVGGEHVAYTTGTDKIPTIYINKENALVPKSGPEKVKFVDGLFSHELAHQMFTDFNSHTNFLKILENGSLIHFNTWFNDCGLTPPELTEALSSNEVNLFHNLWNAVEDTSIEFWFFHTINGDLPDSLRFAITNTFKVSDPLNVIESPFNQVMAAMIQYGDVGILKGKFTYPEARDAFLDIQPIYDKAIEEPNARTRLALAYIIFDKLRPLWKPEMEQQEAMQKLMEELQKLMQSMGEGADDHSESSGKGKYSSNASKAGSGGDDSESNEKNKSRRTKTIEMTKKEYEEAMKNASSGSGEGEPVSIKIVDDKENGSGSKDETKDGKGSEPNSDSDPNGKSERSQNDSDNEKGKPNAERQGLGNIDTSEYDYDKENEDIWEESELSEEEINSILSSMEKELSDEMNFEKKESKDDGDLPDFNIVGRGFTKAKCLNVKVNTNSDSRVEAKYNDIVASMKPDITRLAAQLKRATSKPNVVKTKKSTGALNIGRYAKIDVCQTTKLFDKRRTAGANDLAVFVAVDNSGSMSGDRIAYARKSTIAIAEACAASNIPIYVMGFTADTHGADAYHLHFIRWKNSLMERYSLMDIEAKCNNFDGYSIRYASQILKKRTEANKLLVVISDGQPSCRSYYDYNNGAVGDVKEAVRQAVNDGLVVHGIAIGGNDTDILREMYGTNFTENESLSSLFKDFGAALIKQLKK